VTQGTGTSKDTDVAIVGAGPYGLSLAAHLRSRGVAFRIFGQPMRFWQQLGGGRYLKSYGFATNIYGPGCRTFVDYSRERSLEPIEPCAIEDFARYGIWVQQRELPELEPVDIAAVTPAAPGFALTTVSGERLRARRVVMAVGLRHFGHIPAELQSLPAGRVTHTSLLDDFGALSGQEVAVIGAGQSALESAALLNEAGARPHLFVRGPSVHFGDRTPLEKRPLFKRLRAPQSVLGPGLKNWGLEHFPSLLHHAPDRLRLPFTRSHLGPSGAWWLKDRVLPHVPIHVRARLLEARDDGRIQLRFQEPDGEVIRTVDHVVAGTGYDIDLDRLTLLDSELGSRLRRVARAPALDRHFQASLPGLYFIGPASAPSFGPLFRFVAGAAYAAPTVAQHLARTTKDRSAEASNPESLSPAAKHA
jgi:cation diffusion facilitator CzcD-associated flavoprotein CzcO